MSELLSEALAFVNLPFTVLLGLVVCYWLLVALGALDTDFGGGDLDAHVDGHLDLHHGHEGDLDGHGAGHGHDHDGGGFLSSAAQFVNIGDVPLMVVLSVISLSLWLGSLLANYYLTDHNVLFAMALLVPNFLVSLVVARYLTMPLKPVFRLLRRDDEDKPIEVVGQPCRITTRASSTVGQAEIELSGAPLLIDVRTLDGAALPKGSTAVVVRHDLERGIYYVAEVPPLTIPQNN